MSSLALPREAARSTPGRGRLSTWVDRRGEAILLATPIVALALMTLAQLGRSINIDTWLALVTGRLVWQTGIPHTETLTAMSHGIAWVDQQWLSQVALYALYRLGGLGLVGVVNCALLLAGAAIATACARRNGAAFRTTLIVLPICLATTFASREVRTQAFAVPLFALLVSLLAADARRPSHRVFWCLPLLVVWANVHGTVTLGAGLVALHGLTTLLARRRTLLRSARAWIRPLVLLIGPALALLATPYGLAIIGYYRATMISPTLRQSVGEWQPVTTMPALAVGVIAVTGLAVWGFARHPGRTTRWEKLAVLIIAASAIEVRRNSLFLAILAIAIVPVTLGWGPGTGLSRAGRPRLVINGSIAALLATATILLTAITLARPASALEWSGQRPGVLAAVRTATEGHQSLRVMADAYYADWLLWREPALAGRIANDARFELLSPGQMARVKALFGHRGAAWKRGARGYRLLVLDRRYEPAAYAAFTHEPGRRILYRDDDRAVILRSAAAAGAN